MKIFMTETSIGESCEEAERGSCLHREGQGLWSCRDGQQTAVSTHGQELCVCPKGRVRRLPPAQRAAEAVTENFWEGGHC